MGITLSRCIEAEYELFESEHPQLTITQWSIEDPPLSAQREFTLAELQAAGYQFPFSTDGLSADAKFSQKIISTTYLVHRAMLKTVSVIASMEIDGDAFDAVRVDEHTPRLLGDCKVLKKTTLGDLKAGEHAFTQIVYSLADFERRILHLFLLSEDVVILKARLLLYIPEGCRGPFEPMDKEALRERESRLRTIILSSSSDSPFFTLYDPDHLAQAISMAQAVRKPPTSYILAQDGTALAFRAYEPMSGGAKALILFMAANSFFMDGIAAMLASDLCVSAYVCELRGFGHSGGKRGGVADQPRILFGDCRSFVRHFRWNHPALPVILCGHSVMAGFCLNYCHLHNREHVDGLVLISPNFGGGMMKMMRKEMRESLKSSNVYHLSITFFQIHAKSRLSMAFSKLTHGRIFGERPAVSMAVDESVLSVNPMIVSDFSVPQLLLTELGQLCANLDLSEC